MQLWGLLSLGARVFTIFRASPAQCMEQKQCLVANDNEVGTSTIVCGFAMPEMKVELEATALRRR